MEYQENPLPFELKTNTATIYSIPNELTQNFLGLVITDQHLGKFISFNSGFPKFKSKLDSLLSQTKATCLFMLGDTIDYRCRDYSSAFNTVFNYLETLQIPVFLLGGNHDKERIQKLHYKFDKNLKFIEDTFIRVSHPSPNGEKYSAIIMGHDLGNNFQVDPCDAPTYVKWMGDVFNKYFKPSEMMLLGHTHQNISIPENESYSIMQFSPDFRSFQYAIIKDVGGKFNVILGDMNDK